MPSSLISSSSGSHRHRHKSLKFTVPLAYVGGRRNCACQFLCLLRARPERVEAPPVHLQLRSWANHRRWSTLWVLLEKVRACTPTFAHILSCAAHLISLTMFAQVSPSPLRPESPLGVPPPPDRPGDPAAQEAPEAGEAGEGEGWVEGVGRGVVDWDASADLLNWA